MRDLHMLVRLQVHAQGAACLVADALQSLQATATKDQLELAAGQAMAQTCLGFSLLLASASATQS